jgi:D-threo-aldose 1-dehydrogenase
VIVRHAESVRLGADGPLLTRLGLGAAPIGGLFQPVSPEEARSVVRRALELGVGYIDTAPLYGLGASERRVGEALKELPRSSFTVSTKVGRLVRERPAEYESLPVGMWHVPESVKSVFDFTHDGIRRSLEESLERLGLDRVDIAFVHDPADRLDAAIEVALPALAGLREEGLVDAIGAGMTDAYALARIVRAVRPDCVLLAGRYTLLDQSALAELLPLCIREGVGVIVGGVFNSGILADPSPGARFDYAQARQPELERAHRAASVCAAHGVPLPAAALQFALGHPAVLAVLTGVRSVAELEANVRFFDVDVPAGVWADLVAQGIVSEAAPLPEAVHA